jgi:hypothetical protein
MQGFIGGVTNGGMFKIIFPADLNGTACKVQKMQQGQVQPIDLQNSVGDFLIIEGDYDPNTNLLTCMGGRQLMTGLNL